MPTRFSLRDCSRLVGAAGLLAFGLACGGATTPSAQSEAAGVYVLVSVSGRGPESGTFVLTRDGRATRTVKYPATVRALEYVLFGTYGIDASGIAFTLSESMISSFMWPVRGEWRGSSFTIRYPDPADGADIIETYRRL